MINLNSKQRKALKALIPLDGTQHLYADLASGETDLHGLTPREAATYSVELARMGAIRIKKTDDGDCSLRLLSDAAGYFKDLKLEIARSFLRFIGQLCAGASGGLVVFILSRALGA